MHSLSRVQGRAGRAHGYGCFKLLLFLGMWGKFLSRMNGIKLQIHGFKQKHQMQIK